MIQDFNEIINKASGQIDQAASPGFEKFLRGKDEDSGSLYDSAIMRGDFLSAYSCLRGHMEEGELPFASLVYMDPPFLTGSDHTAPIKLRTENAVFKLERNAYSDKMDFHEYLVMIASALMAGRELLSDNGSLWIHLDSRAVHYAKVLADEIFGGRAHLMN
ncbi:MAG: site-specific DNA-methyltransferase, partial [Clostridiales Family XIII bacterium]|nr:site-specific DNA-methyltransferase [Clostridiales Family XIII bacterium]